MSQCSRNQFLHMKTLPRRVKARTTPDAPLPMIPPTTTSSKVGKPSLFSSQLEQLLLILQSLHQLSLQQPVMTLEAFLSQVAWAGVQLPSIRGVISLILVMMMSQMLELMMIMLRTSLLHMKLGIQGPHRIKAHFDKNFSLIF